MSPFIECQLCDAQFVLIENLVNNYSLEPQIYKLYWEEISGTKESFLINQKNQKDYGYMFVADTTFLRMKV